MIRVCAALALHRAYYARLWLCFHGREITVRCTSLNYCKERSRWPVDNRPTHTNTMMSPTVTAGQDGTSPLDRPTAQHKKTILQTETCPSLYTGHSSVHRTRTTWRETQAKLHPRWKFGKTLHTAYSSFFWFNFWPVSSKQCVVSSFLQCTFIFDHLFLSYTCTCIAEGLCTTTLLNAKLHPTWWNAA